MRRANHTIDQPDPWRVPVMVTEIPAVGLHRDIEPSPVQRRAMAELGFLGAGADRPGSRRVGEGGRAARGRRDRPHLDGRRQTCVVTLDPIENDIDEPIDVVFAPPEQIPELAELVDEAKEVAIETPDPPEPLLDGMIDLGRLATDALFLAIDPYPRRKDAVFEPPVEPADPDAHPFAALKALQLGAKAPRAKKPKKR